VTRRRDQGGHARGPLLVDEKAARHFRSSFPDPEASDFRTRSWERSTETIAPYRATLLDALVAAGRSDTGITLLGGREDDPEEPRAYRAILDEAQQAAAALAALGVRRGERVMIVLPTSFEFVSAFFAVLMVGAVPVPAYPPAMLEKAELAVERLCHIAGALGVTWCIANRELHPILGELVLAAGGLGHVLTVEDLRGTSRIAVADASADDLAFIQCTSGSTGHPKGVVLTHANVLTNIHAIGQACRINRRDVGVSWLPLYHDMGLIGALLFCIYWRIPLVLLPPLAFLSQPSRWLRAIHHYRATLSAAPNFAYGLCAKRVKPAERERLDLSSWRLAMNGAEPVNLRTLTDFERAFAPCGFRASAILPVYGLAEASLAVAFPTPGAPLRHEVVDREALARGRAVRSRGKGSIALVSVGRAVPGHRIQVLDEVGQSLGEREVGHIAVSGPSVMRGYCGDDAATHAVKRDGWLWTGDLGYLSDGELYVTGRAKDLIIVRGRNHYAEDLERVAERVEGVRPGGAAAFAVYDEDRAAELAVLVCETRVDQREARLTLVERISERVAHDCSLTLDEVVLVAPGSIPKTSSGKRQRALCRERYLRGELKPRATSALGLTMVFVRSRAGFIVGGVKRLFRRRLRPSD
jgi:acyl-CoA synthetase (AMP-forming)/AMP-acid ligase II